MTSTDSQNDELMHPVGEQAAWSESYYFNFVDPKNKLAMFTRVGFRPQDGWADALHVVYLGGKRVAFTYGRRNIEKDLSLYDGDLTAGDLTISCSAAFKKWQISYKGPAQDIEDGAILLERRKLRRDGWYQPATLDMQVQFDCTTEPYHSRSDEAASGAFGHFEQSGRVSGVIQLGEEKWNVSGFGVRDKSWGPRDWGAGAHSSESESKQIFSSAKAPSPFVNWFSMNFGEDVALGGSGFRHADGVVRGSGWIQRNGESTHLNNIVITSNYAADSILHTQVFLKGEIAGGEIIEISGKILNVCPTKVPMPGGATFINEGLAEYTWGDKVGYGITEHWHAVSMGS
jgi:hypothetical protein